MKHECGPFDVRCQFMPHMYKWDDAVNKDPKGYALFRGNFDVVVNVGGRNAEFDAVGKEIE